MSGSPSNQKFFTTQKMRRAKKARGLKQENDDGNMEYKFKINDWNPARRENLKTQMMYRLYQGDGQAIYNIGFHDDGRPHGLIHHKLFNTLDAFFEMAESLEIEIKSVKIFKGEQEGYCCNIYIEKDVNTDLLPPGAEDL